GKLRRYRRLLRIDRIAQRRRVWSKIQITFRVLCGSAISFQFGVFSSSFIHIFFAEPELFEAFLLLHLLSSRRTVASTIVVDVISVGLRRARQIRRADRRQLLMTIAAAEVFLRAVCHAVRAARTTGDRK